MLRSILITLTLIGASELIAEDPAWLDRVEREIAESEYHFTPRDSQTLSAPNRVQNFRSEIGLRGLTVTPRLEGEWRFELELVRFGRDDDWSEAEIPRLSNQESRALLGRPGIDEWFVNRPDGLEHGLTVDAAPAGTGELRFEFRTRGLHAHPGADASALQLRGLQGRSVLEYSGLAVFDATGDPLPARLSPTAGGFRIDVDDTNAAYPVTVDPLLTIATPAIDGQQAFSEFGLSISTAGDVNGDGFSDLLVGAPEYDAPDPDEGKAWLYLGSATGLSSTPTWTAEGDQPQARFGHSVSAAGDVNGDGFDDVIIGAPRFDDGQTDEGAAFCYLGSPTGLDPIAVIVHYGNQPFAQFGSAVSTAGDTNGDGFDDVIVAAPLGVFAAEPVGWVSVYAGVVGGLSPVSFAILAGTEPDAEFGHSVSTAGDVNGDGLADLIIGNPGLDSTLIDAGAAHVYFGVAGGWPSGTPDWSVAGGQSFARLGTAVGLAGDVDGDGYSDVLIGAPDHGVGGRAQLHSGSSGGPTDPAAWTRDDLSLGARFGASVFTAGDVDGDGYADIVVGAPGDSTLAAGAGRADLYAGSVVGLTVFPAWTVHGAVANAEYGTAVTTAGDVDGNGFSDVVVSAPRHTDDTVEEGRVSLYLGLADHLAANHAWLTTAGQPGADYGFRVASAGDVNGDGYGDVVVGAPLYDGGEIDEGRVFVYYGSSDGPSTVADAVLEADVAGARFGDGVAAAGDVNNDGYGDVLVGASQFTVLLSDVGAAFVYLGSAGGIDPTAAWTAHSDDGGSDFGECVSTVGDFDADGFADIVVGARAFGGDGAAFIYRGGPAGPTLEPTQILVGGQAGARYGESVAWAGDVNRDGYSDLVVGAPDYTDTFFEEGRAFLYHGSTLGFASTPGWTGDGGEVEAHFGESVDGAGDVNRDGYSDLVIGAPTHDGGAINAGSIFLYEGSASGPTLGTVINDDSIGAQFGRAVSSAGDVNRDGYSDGSVGAPFANSGGGPNEGRVDLFVGSPNGLHFIAPWTLSGGAAQVRLGTDVGTAGDTNGDGFGDIIVGGPGLFTEGGSAVYFGGGGAGRERRTAQWRFDGSKPIALLGRESTSSDVQLRVVGSSAYGRDELRVEWELRPLQFPLDGALAQVELPHDSGAPLPGSGSAVDISTLAATPFGGAVHWNLRLLGRSPFFPRSPWLTLPHTNWSEEKLRVGLAILADPGEDFACTPEGSGTFLSWSNGATYDSVVITRDGAPLVVLPGTATSYFDPTPGSEYCMVGVIGGESSEAVCCSLSVEPEFIRGDCSADGLVNIADAISALDQLFSGIDVNCKDACDANDDGVVDIADAIYLLSSLFVLGPAPSAPYPSCGPDPTMDTLSCELSSCP